MIGFVYFLTYNPKYKISRKADPPTGGRKNPKIRRIRSYINFWNVKHNVKYIKRIYERNVYNGMFSERMMVDLLMWY